MQQSSKNRSRYENHNINFDFDSGMRSNCTNKNSKKIKQNWKENQKNEREKWKAYFRILDLIISICSWDEKYKIITTTKDLIKINEEIRNENSNWCYKIRN